MTSAIDSITRRALPVVDDVLTFDEVRAIALAEGADDAAAVPLDHPDLVEEVGPVRSALPGARSLVSIVMRTHPENIQSPRRSVSNREFHHVGHEVDDVARRVAKALSRRGYRTINPSMAFPMEMEDFPGRTWVVSHKRVAVAAQLGRMGIHRSVIHPRFGSFVLLGTVITEARVDGSAPPLDFDPCVSCKLCVAACPVGAIEPDGAFRFSACMDHNYREFMTGFSDFAEEIADSRDRQDLRERMPLPEMVSMWQSLSYGPNYKAAYCIAVCPAGEGRIDVFRADRAAHLKNVMKPLTERVETVFVVAGTDAEAHVAKRFPHKRVRVVRSSLRALHARGFFRSLPLVFQRGPARGWAATFHFELEENGAVQSTVRIDDGKLEVTPGLVGTADVTVRASARVWLDVVSKKRNPVWAVVTGKLRVEGKRALLDRFAACFPR